MYMYIYIYIHTAINITCFFNFEFDGVQYMYGSAFFGHPLAPNAGSIASSTRAILRTSTVSGTRNVEVTCNCMYVNIYICGGDL